MNNIPKKHAFRHIFSFVLRFSVFIPIKKEYVPQDILLLIFSVLGVCTTKPMPKHHEQRRCRR